MGQAVQFSELGIPEAAQRLGISIPALRKRISRHQLQARKVGSRWVVLLPDVDTAGTESGQPLPGQADESTSEMDKLGVAAVLSDLREEIDRLWRELEARTEELRRKDYIIADLTRRIPELPATLSPAQPQQHRQATTDRHGQWWSGVLRVLEGR
jgi:hypothetical protein